MNGPLFPLRASPAALRTVVRRAFDPDESFRERAEELAGEAFDDCDTPRVWDWLASDAQDEDVCSFAIAKWRGDDDGARATTERLREKFVSDMADEYYAAVDEEIAREADERDDDYLCRMEAR